MTVEFKEWLLACKPGAYAWATVSDGFSGVHLPGLRVTLVEYDKAGGGEEPLCMVSEEYLDDLNAGLDTYQSFGDVGHDDGRYGVLVRVESDCVAWLAWDEEEEDFYYDVFVVTAPDQELSVEQRSLFCEDPDPVQACSPGAISGAIGAWVSETTGRNDLCFYHDDEFVPKRYIDAAKALLALHKGGGLAGGSGGGGVNSAFFEAVEIMGPAAAAELVADLRLEMLRTNGSQ
jgi:hypothetical protein